jgi:WD40 repeat protein
LQDGFASDNQGECISPFTAFITNLRKRSSVDMKSKLLKTLKMLGVGTAVSLLSAGFSTAAIAAPFALGDVFASTGDGKVHVYSQTGALKQVLDTGLGGYTTGSTFDSLGNFYVTAFSANKVSKFNNNGTLVNATWANGIAAVESIVFDSADNAYLGNAGAAQIQKVNSSGTPITTYNVLQNTDWIDLAADQKTVLYSNEGNTIREINTVTNVDTVFTSGAYGRLFAKRYLTSGGVIAASDNGNVYRWDALGALQQTYNAGIGGVFALNLDPNGSSFWTGTLGGQNVKKINLVTGATEQSWSTGIGQLYGLSVFGEIQAGGGGAGGGGGTSAPEPETLVLFAAGLIGVGAIRRRKLAVAKNA